MSEQEILERQLAGTPRAAAQQVCAYDPADNGAATCKCKGNAVTRQPSPLPPAN